LDIFLERSFFVLVTRGKMSFSFWRSSSQVSAISGTEICPGTVGLSLLLVEAMSTSKEDERLTKSGIEKNEGGTGSRFLILKGFTVKHHGALVHWVVGFA